MEWREGLAAVDLKFCEEESLRPKNKLDRPCIPLKDSMREDDARLCGLIRVKASESIAVVQHLHMYAQTKQQLNS